MMLNSVMRFFPAPSESVISGNSSIRVRQRTENGNFYVRSKPSVVLCS